MFDILKNYLRKEPYYFVIMSDSLYIKNYKKIYEITDTFVLLEIDGLYKISGKDFKVVKNEKNEISIKGYVESIVKS